MPTTEKIKLPVLSKEIGLANQKSYYVVRYKNVEYKIPLFDFQKKEDTPKTLVCNIKDGRITQDICNLYDKLYSDTDKLYLFRIKNKWEKFKYYEIEDPRIENDGIYYKLPFNESAFDLEKGQEIICSVKGIRDGKLIIHFEEKKASTVEFYELDSIFAPDGNPDMKAWLEELFDRKYMFSIKNMYDSKNGKWIFYFARNIERILYDLLASGDDGNGDMAVNFCERWLKTIEYSPFIANMGENARAYNEDLTNSIEICEDFLDAVRESDKKQKIADCIASMNPNFYQYRTDKRFRFLACAFNMDFTQLEENITQLFEKIKVMGEEKCSDGSVALALMHILKLYVNRTSRDLENSLSFDSTVTVVIKKCVLALCYLIKIMFRCNYNEGPIYSSRLYQLLSLLNIVDEGKYKLLGNSYRALFADSSPLMRRRWEDLESIVMNQSYVFWSDEIVFAEDRHLVYDDGNTCVDMSVGQINMSPLNTDEKNMKTYPLINGLSAGLCYGKSLSKLSQKPDFKEIQSVWKDVELSVFATAKNVRSERKTLVDGDDVDIYITEIIDEQTARCKVVDYDEEGEILFNDLFFYKKPQLTIEDFIGSDGSPLVFPAIYSNRDGKNVFDATEFKIYYAKDMLPEQRLRSCIVISALDNGWCQGITPDGFFVNFKQWDGSVQRTNFVDVFVNEVNVNGYGVASFEGFSETAFNNSKVYVNYLKGFNSYFYRGEGTLASLEAETGNFGPSRDHISVSKNYIRTLADIVSKMARLEPELRNRFGYLAICNMLSRLIKDEDSLKLYQLRMKYTEVLYGFSVNNRILGIDVEQFLADTADFDGVKEIQERRNVIEILGKFRKTTFREDLDGTLIGFLTSESSPLEKELSRLVLSSNMLTKFTNKLIEDQILDAMGVKLNIVITHQQPVHIGLEEGQTVEFKTSIVYPPNNNGIEDIEQQSDNIIREISAMMNTDGGTLYIGVNDEGNVVGLQNDLEYFSKNGTCDDVKSRDNFMNRFSWLLTCKFGALDASKFSYAFRDIEGYQIFEVSIPKLPSPNNDYIRVGTTCQKK